MSFKMNNTAPKPLLVLVVFLIAAPLVIDGEIMEQGWPQFRGPNGDGISTETDWNPEAISGQPDVVWKTNVGTGFSNLAIKGKYIYTMGFDKNKDTVFCLDIETGKVIWRYSYTGKSGGRGYGTQTTPAADGKFVYTLSVDGHLYCFNAKNGRVLWHRDIVAEFGATAPYYGFAGSPVIEGNLVIVTGNRSGIALDKATGKKVWSSAPVKKKYHGHKTGTEYTTPVFYTQKGKRYAAIFSGDGLYSVDVNTGREIWFYEWKLNNAKYSNVNAADPVIFDNKVFISSAYNVGSALIDISGKKPKLLWRNRNMHNHFSTSIYLNGYIYGSDGDVRNSGAKLTCLDIKTGKKMWAEGMRPLSLTAADGKLIALDDKGTLFIIEATRLAYNEISRGTIPAQRGYEKWWSYPVLHNGRIYCRNNVGDLVSIDVSN
jgi:outer membrane protein assembly factor BamB